MKTATEWKALLRARLTAAMRAKESLQVLVLRQLLSIVDQAGAVPLTAAPPPDAGPIAQAVSGLGAGDVSRAEVSPEALLALLQREQSERLTSAETYETLGRGDEASRLRTEADLVARLLEEAT